MNFEITLADLAIVDTETGEELLDFGSLFVPDENPLPVDPLVKMPKQPAWLKFYDPNDDEIEGETF